MTAWKTRRIVQENYFDQPTEMVTFSEAEEKLKEAELKVQRETETRVLESLAREIRYRLAAEPTKGVCCIDCEKPIESGTLCGQCANDERKEKP